MDGGGDGWWVGYLLFVQADWRPIWAANLPKADCRLIFGLHKKRLSSR